MNKLANSMRQRGRELQAALDQTLSTKPVDANLVGAIKAAVLAELLIVLGDMLEVLDEAGPSNAAELRLQKIISRNNATRLAAAAAIEGNWDEFDRIIDANGGDPASAGETPSA